MEGVDPERHGHRVRPDVRLHDREPNCRRAADHAHDDRRGAAAFAVQITTGGKVRIVNSAGTNIATSTASLPLNAQWRLEVDVTGISGSTGHPVARFYSGSNLETGTPDETVDGGARRGGRRSHQRGSLRLLDGYTQSGANWDVWLADMAFSDTAQPGVYVPPASSSGAFLMFMS
jgi:hypothetical protein